MKSQQDAIFLKFIFDKELYMFRTDLLSIIRSLNALHIAIGICRAIYVDCLLARLGWTVDLSETCRVLERSVCTSLTQLYCVRPVHTLHSSVF